MKYRNNTGLGLEEVNRTIPSQNNVLQESFTNTEQQPLDNFLKISNPEYHKAKGRPPKRYKSSVECNNKHTSKSDEVAFKTCSYCSGKGHNIRSCAKYKADKENNNNQHAR